MSKLIESKREMTHLDPDQSPRTKGSGRSLNSETLSPQTPVDPFQLSHASHEVFQDNDIVSPELPVRKQPRRPRKSKSEKKKQEQ